jgi:hypothetical protein
MFVHRFPWRWSDDVNIFRAAATYVVISPQQFRQLPCWRSQVKDVNVLSLLYTVSLVEDNSRFWRQRYTYYIREDNFLLATRGELLDSLHLRTPAGYLAKLLWTFNNICGCNPKNVDVISPPSFRLILVRFLPIRLFYIPFSLFRKCIPPSTFA